jgi:hypothetical protein
VVIKQQAPLKVDPEVDALITNSAHFLGLTKKELVADAVRAYVEQRREEIRAQMREVMRTLDGSRRSRVALLTGLSPERLDELGGVGE